MTQLTPVPTPEPSPRIDNILAVRAGATALWSDALRIKTLAGAHWSTEAAEAESIELCSLIAEDALRLRRTLIAAKKARQS